ncbi:phosphatase, partial [Streptomyces sp. SID10815]|nr:phosphatase [Streptomyces sp. SID10815]
MAGIDSTVPAPAHTVAPVPTASAAAQAAAAHPAAGSHHPHPPGTLLQDRLAGWVSDLTTLHELTERLTRTNALDAALTELLRAGAALVGARRGLVVLEPDDGLGPDTTVGLGLARADLGHIETVPRGAMPYGALLDTAAGLPGGAGEVVRPDLFAEEGLDARHREVAARLGYAAGYALPLSTEAAGRLGAAGWLYDEPAEPTERQRHLAGLYVRFATEHLARLLEGERTRACMATV